MTKNEFQTKTGDLGALCIFFGGMFTLGALPALVYGTGHAAGAKWAGVRRHFDVASRGLAKECEKLPPGDERNLLLDFVKEARMTVALEQAALVYKKFHGREASHAKPRTLNKGVKFIEQTMREAGKPPEEAQKLAALYLGDRFPVCGTFSGNLNRTWAQVKARLDRKIETLKLEP